MRTMGAVTDRHDGIRDQLPDPGGLVSMWIPGIAGRLHARKAIQAGKDLAHAISRDKFLTSTMPGGVVVDTARGLVAIVGALGTALEFHAGDDAIELAAIIAEQTGQGEFIVTARAAGAGRLPLEGRIPVTYQVDEAGGRESAFLIPIDQPLLWDSD